MKIMTISYRKDSFAALPPEEQRRLNRSSVDGVLAFKKKKGDTYRLYNSPGWGRIISIGEYDSLEEYYQSIMTETAQRGFTTFESYPLIEMDARQIEEALRQS